MGYKEIVKDLDLIFVVVIVDVVDLWGAQVLCSALWHLIHLDKVQLVAISFC